MLKVLYYYIYQCSTKPNCDLSSKSFSFFFSC